MIMPKIGIDISYANSVIDWGKASKEIDFAIIRSSFGSDLPSQTDSYFYRNANGCVKYNVPFAIYHFAYFINTDKAKEEADFAIRLANEYKKYIKFIALDVEEDSERYAQRVGADPDWTKCAVAFMERIKSAGYTPVLYTNQSWLLNKYDRDNIKKYKLWYAAPDADSPKYDPAIWQYSWKGKVSGIIGDVDMNYIYDESLITSEKIHKTTKRSDDTKFLDQAVTYIDKNGDYVCNKKLKLGAVYDWCAFAVSSIMNDLGFIKKYIAKIEGGAGSIARESDGKYGRWFKKYDVTPKPGDLIFFRYNVSGYSDKYHSDHVGIVESIDGNTIITLEGNVDGSGSDWAATSKFRRKTRNLSDRSVYAFYRPNWKNTSSIAVRTDNTDISQVNSAQSVNEEVVIAARDGVNIRSGASTSYKILGAVPYNCRLRITRKTSGGGYTWGLTTYNGITGWIALNYTKKVNKTIDELAYEVILGKWSSGDERKKLLEDAGYDYYAVQNRVNQLLSQ